MFPMKTRVPSLLFIALVMACASHDLSITLHEGSLGVPIVVGARDKVTFRDSEIQVKVTKLEESRCPEDVQCIQAGYAHVQFHIDATNDSVSLFIPPVLARQQDDKYVFTYRQRQYTLRLIEVRPYPTTKNREEARTAEFVLTTE